MIKASYEVLQPVNGLSFLLRKFGSLAFEAPYHFHAEYELTYIVEGGGKRYVGSNMQNFASGDLVLIGPNVPHCWKLDPVQEAEAIASAIVIQFDGAFLGDDFFNKEELQHIKRLFEKSASGINFHGDTALDVAGSLFVLSEEKTPFRMLIGLLEALQRLAQSTEYLLLDQSRVVGARSLAEQERINPVFAYLVENFRHNVSLDIAAGMANMTTNAFCKYFKKITRKTFMETVIEYRLNYAIQQLVQTDKSISEIAFESGFGDVSHFYKMFKVKMQLSPLNYRKKFMRSFESADEQIEA